MADEYMSDLSQVLNLTASRAKKAQHATNDEKSNTLDMQDFLLLMVTQLQNQSIDNTTDTSDMLNQMVQVSVIEAINNITSVVNDSSTMSYAASLVGKSVVVGQMSGNQVVEKEGVVKGTGVLSGKQVIFLEDDSCYYLTDIMAVGKLPNDKANIKPENDKTAEDEKTPGDDKDENETKTANEFEGALPI